MKKIYFLLTITFFLTATLYSQSAKAVYAELGGPGLASVNYDMRLSQKQDGIGFRVGIGGFSIDQSTVVTIPVGLNYIFGKDGKNYFEVGAGFTYLSLKDGYADPGQGSFNSSFGNLTFGYRMAPANGGFFFKAQMTPVFGNSFFIPYYGGVSFGYKF